MAEAHNRPRVPSVDILRGAVLILMALDHVRVYSGVPAGGATAAVFFTRWVTHFCAPAFLFLAGTSLFLSSGGRPSARLSRLLFVRGLWIVLLELTVVRLGWTFNFGYDENLLAGVLWAIGWSMVLMALLVHLPRAALATFAFAVIAGHNVIGQLYMQGNPWESPYPWLFRIVYAGGYVNIGERGPELDVLYSIVPWVGVMAAGYLFGAILRMERDIRDRWCYRIGLSMVALFVALRASGIYGDPRVWPTDYARLPAWLAFFNPQKYPASLQFLLMTLGPSIALIPLLEKSAGAAANALARIGRVPMFFYLLHIPLIHLVAVGIAAVRTPGSIGWLFEDHPLPRPPVPDGYVYGLGLLYVVWIGVSILLFFPCRWYAGVRPGLPKWWRNLV